MASEREVRSEALWRDVDAITTPTLLLRGEKSPILSAEAAREMAARMTRCELVEIPGAGHSVQGDNPRAFAAAFDRFVASILAGG